MARIRATIKLNKTVFDKFKQLAPRGFVPIGPEIKEMLRRGKGSVNAQFISKRTITFGGSIGWKAKSNPWGTRKSRSAPGVDSGSYKAAWLGGPGSFFRTTRATVSGGVQKSKFPQVTFMQAETPSTWYPKRKVSGSWAARIFHGLTNNVWISNARFTKGFVHNPRAISMNSGIEKRVSRFMERYVVWLIDPANNTKPSPIR